MPIFHEKILALRNQYDAAIASCCFFTSPNSLCKALNDYNELAPTDRQFQAVIDALVKRKNDPDLTTFFCNLHKVSQGLFNTSCSRLDTWMSAWLILERAHVEDKNIFLKMEHLPEFPQLTWVLYLLEKKVNLDEIYISEITNRSKLYSLILLLNNKRLLTSDNLKSLMLLPSYHDSEKGIDFDGDSELMNILDNCQFFLSQKEFETYIDTIHMLHAEIFNDQYIEPSIHLESQECCLELMPHLSCLS